MPASWSTPSRARCSTSSAADSPRYPASVTKVMTLYVLFQELAAGNISLSTKMTVSRHAASAVPTKLGLGAGKTISVEDAIKALVTISANDIARVIAEHISGQREQVRPAHDATAHALGMTHTTYRNASGLPDSGQVTTVRDQAILGIAIYQHFPTYYEYFQTDLVPLRQAHLRQPQPPARQQRRRRHQDRLHPRLGLQPADRRPEGRPPHRRRRLRLRLRRQPRQQGPRAGPQVPAQEPQGRLFRDRDDPAARCAGDDGKRRAGCEHAVRSSRCPIPPSGLRPRPCPKLRSSKPL